MRDAATRGSCGARLAPHRLRRRLLCRFRSSDDRLESLIRSLDIAKSLARLEKQRNEIKSSVEGATRLTGSHSHEVDRLRTEDVSLSADIAGLQALRKEMDARKLACLKRQTPEAVLEVLEHNLEHAEALSDNLGSSFLADGRPEDFTLPRFVAQFRKSRSGFHRLNQLRVQFATATGMPLH